METIQCDPAKVKRKHHPELLRAKRAARALNITWADVTRERDRLRRNEQDGRGHEDSARKDAWRFWVARSGWDTNAQAAWWRNGFQRVFGRKLARGADYLCVRFADEVAGAVREGNPEYSEWDDGEIWEFLLSEYQPLKPVWEYYNLAILRLAAAQLPMGDSYADAGSDAELNVPF